MVEMQNVNASFCDQISELVGSLCQKSHEPLALIDSFPRPKPIVSQYSPIRPGNQQLVQSPHLKSQILTAKMLTSQTRIGPQITQIKNELQQTALAQTHQIDKACGLVYKLARAVTRLRDMQLRTLADKKDLMRQTKEMSVRQAEMLVEAEQSSRQITHLLRTASESSRTREVIKSQVLNFGQELIAQHQGAIIQRLQQLYVGFEKLVITSSRRRGLSIVPTHQTAVSYDQVKQIILKASLQTRPEQVSTNVFIKLKQKMHNIDFAVEALHLLIRNLKKENSSLKLQTIELEREVDDQQVECSRLKMSTIMPELKPKESDQKCIKQAIDMIKKFRMPSRDIDATRVIQSLDRLNIVVIEVATRLNRRNNVKESSKNNVQWLEPIQPDLSQITDQINQIQQMFDFQQLNQSTTRLKQLTQRINGLESTIKLSQQSHQKLLASKSVPSTPQNKMGVSIATNQQDKIRNLESENEKLIREIRLIKQERGDDLHIKQLATDRGGSTPDDVKKWLIDVLRSLKLAKVFTRKTIEGLTEMWNEIPGVFAPDNTQWLCEALGVEQVPFFKNVREVWGQQVENTLFAFTAQIYFQRYAKLLVFPTFQRPESEMYFSDCEEIHPIGLVLFNLFVVQKIFGYENQQCQTESGKIMVIPPRASQFFTVTMPQIQVALTELK